MAAPVQPFTAFNFSVEINRGTDGSPLVNAEFSECDGLEMSMEVKTIREGGAIGPPDPAERARQLQPAHAQAGHDRRFSACGPGFRTAFMTRACALMPKSFSSARTETPSARAFSFLGACR